MSALHAMFSDSTSFLAKGFKNGTVKNFIDAAEIGIYKKKSQSENVLIKTVEDVWDSFPPQHVDFNNCCLLLITEHIASCNKHVRVESS